MSEQQMEELVSVVEPPTKRCSMCRERKPFADFGPNARGIHGLRPRCRPCESEAQMAWRDQNADSALNSHLKRKFGITLEEYRALLVKQGGVCAICGEPPVVAMGIPSRRQGRMVNPRLVVDHDHDSGRVRGLLCVTCNVGMGGLKDSVELLRNAIKYLEGGE